MEVCLEANHSDIQICFESTILPTYKIKKEAEETETPESPPDDYEPQPSPLSCGHHLPSKDDNSLISPEKERNEHRGEEAERGEGMEPRGQGTELAKDLAESEKPRLEPQMTDQGGEGAETGGEAKSLDFDLPCPILDVQQVNQPAHSREKPEEASQPANEPPELPGEDIPFPSGGVELSQPEEPCPVLTNCLQNEAEGPMPELHDPHVTTAPVVFPAAALTRDGASPNLNATDVLKPCSVLLDRSEVSKYMCSRRRKTFRYIKHLDLTLPPILMKQNSPSPPVLQREKPEWPSEEMMRTQRKLHKKKKTCPVCSKKYKGSSGLKYHMLTHSDLRPEKCDVCDKTFKHKKNLGSHKRNVHGINPTGTVLHTEITSTENIIENGIKLRSEKNKINFEIKTFDFDKNNTEFLVNNSDDIKYQCEYCEINYCDQFILKRHLHAIHNIEDEKVQLKLNVIEDEESDSKDSIISDEEIEESEVKSENVQIKDVKRPKLFNIIDVRTVCCKYCKQRFMSYRLKHHIKNMHMPKNEDILCKYCSFKTRISYSMQLHLLKHVDMFIYKCDLCVSRFRSRKGMQEHKLKVHKINTDMPIKPKVEGTSTKVVQKDKKYLCILCKKCSFHKKTLLNTHMKDVHNFTDELHRCEFCNFITENENSLKKHTEKHLTCPICKIIFKTYDEFKEHNNQEHKILKCEYCPYTNTSHYKFKTHLKTHDQIHTCKICNLQCYSVRQLYQHKNEAHGKIRQCQHCSFSTNIPNQFRTHMKIHLQGANCDVCNLEFGSQLLLINHKKSAHKKICYVCLHCQKKFMLLHTYRRHLKLVHNLHENDLDLAIQNTKVESIVQDQNVDDNNSLKRTLGTENSELSNGISIKKIKMEKIASRNLSTDSKSGNSSTDHKIHKIKLEKDLGPDYYTCYRCNKCYNSDAALKVHIDVEHNENKILNCQHCKFSTTNSYDLKLHLKTGQHIKDQGIFKCEICDLKFIKKIDLEKHKNMQHHVKLEVENFSCSDCNKQLSSQLALNAHIESEHTGKTIACVHCPLKFKTPYNLKCHFRKDHNGVSIINNSKSKQRRSKSRLYYYLKCTFCKLHFDTDESLNNHIENMHSSASNLKYSLEILKAKSLSMKYQCQDCKKYFETVEILSKHIETDHNSKDNNIDFEEILNAENPVMKFQCFACNKHFQTVEILSSHVQKKHNSKDDNIDFEEMLNAQNPAMKFQCFECKRLFQTMEILSAHVESKHKARSFDDEQTNSEAKHQCTFCKNNFDTKQLLESHVKKEHYIKTEQIDFAEIGIKKHQCLECSEYFKSKELLTSHTLSKHGGKGDDVDFEAILIAENKNDKFECFHCKKYFETIEILSSHIESEHTASTQDNMDFEAILNSENTKYSCKECKIDFDLKENLTAHVESGHCIKDIHVIASTKSTKHQCFACKKIFNSNKKLASHFKIDHPIKVEVIESENLLEIESMPLVFNCSDCKLEFDSKENLISHIETEHLVKSENIVFKGFSNENCNTKFQCYDCKKDFDSKEILVSHIENEHNVNNQNICVDEIPSVVKFQCYECKQDFDTKEMLTSHIEAGHNVKQIEEVSSVEKFQCYDCKKEFDSKEILVSHIENEHSVKNENLEFDESSNDAYQCYDCKLDFKSKSELASHIHYQHLFNENPIGIKTKQLPKYQCIDCKQYYNSRKVLVRHLKLKHMPSIATIKKSQGNAYQCLICPYSTNNSYHLKLHMTKHSNARPFQCNQCNATFKTQNKLSQHEVYRHTQHRKSVFGNYKNNSMKGEIKQEKNLTPGKKYRCLGCNKYFVSKSILINHIQMVHISKQKEEFSCNSCTFTTKTRFLLKLHMVKHDNIRIKKYTNTHVFDCNLCEKKFKTKQGLKYHQMNEYAHKNDSVFNCNLCTYTANTRHLLTIHMEEHGVTRVHNCNDCEKKFQTLGGLKYHQKMVHGVHISQPLLTCNSCTYTTKNRYILKLHMEKHGNSHILQCNICQKKLKTKLGFKRHQELYHDIHINEQFLKCDSCTYTTKTRYLLQLHMVKHINFRPYKCQICNKIFKKTMDLANHTKVHNSKEPHKKTLKPIPVKDESRNTNEDKVKRTPTKSDSKIKDDRFICFICEKYYDTERGLKKHNLLSHNSEDAIINCEFCTYSTRKSFLLKQHMKKHNNMKQISKCNICSMKFISVPQLQKHEKLAHQQEIKDEMKTQSTTYLNVSNKISTKISDLQKTNHSIKKSNLKSAENSIRKKHNLKNPRDMIHCDICKLHFFKKKSLETHLRAVHNFRDKNIHCRVCSFVTSMPYYLTKHIMRVHTKNFQCKMCPKIYVNEKLLNVHINKKHPTQASTSTDIAENNPKIDTVEIKPKIEYRTPIKIRQYTCEICNISFDEEINLKTHTENAHNVKAEDLFYCKVCSFSTSVANLFVRHCLLHSRNLQNLKNIGKLKNTNNAFLNEINKKLELKLHPITMNTANSQLDLNQTQKKSFRYKDNLNISKLYECTKCPYTTMKSYLFRQHQYVHVNELPFSCNKCNKKFKLERYLKLHQKICGRKIKKIECDICKKLFKDKNDVTTHIKSVHPFIGKKIFCSLCNFFTTSQFLFEKHIASHNDHNPIACNICSETFKTLRRLEMHKKRRHQIHSKPVVISKPRQIYNYTCDICGKKFNQKYQIESHMVLAHWFGNIFKCKLCNYNYNTRERLLEHNMIQHPAPNVFACTACDIKFKSLNLFKMHHTAVHVSQFKIVNLDFIANS